MYIYSNIPIFLKSDSFLGGVTNFSGCGAAALPQFTPQSPHSLPGALFPGHGWFQFEFPISLVSVWIRFAKISSPQFTVNHISKI